MISAVMLSTTQVDPPRRFDADRVYRPEDTREIAGVASGKAKYSLTPEELTRKWGCSLGTAKQTLKVTTQRE
jgi:hypothetical protein